MTIKYAMSRRILRFPKPSATITSTVLLAIFFHLFTASAFAEVDKAQWNEGKSLFKSNCASCHNPKADGTGPALMGVTKRWEGGGDYKGKTGTQWLHTWIHNWNDAVAAGVPYAVAMANSRPSQMNVFTNLKDEDIDKILLYVENPDAGAPAPAVAVAGPQGAGAGNQETGLGTPTYLFAFLLLVLVGILISVTSRLDKVLAEQKGETLNKTPFWKTRKFKGATILVVIIGTLFWLGENGIRMGRQQGYQPTQPIRFSHKLHAGTHKIDCQYCHTSAAKGKASGIPSLNTCMNCHKNVQKGPMYGTEEIGKIYAAVGWDPKQMAYVREPKPVEWVRIHNLPDHVYFNHAQHVVAGKVACQTCHGNIQEMEEVKQFAPLSMGWCVNCHRQTEVQFASNNYYSTYEKLHEDLKNKKIDKVTVEKIGGTECAKCHY
ncbi:MAG: cytochrome c3 family protein [Chitinophagales bacterium]